ncbi:hypothetical protein T484DRAFT_1861251 [Baffinella frigidus]|nr:hypothetical protein T484DRAFT_1861251 [Cryptophyta sp. CCMP2293]
MRYVDDFNGSLFVEDAVLQPMEPHPALSATVQLDTSEARVEQVVKDSSTATWVITLAYKSAQNTFISPFLSRRGVLTESPQLFNASEHPCRKMASICCLVEYNANYHTGTAFSRFVDNTIGRRCAGNGIQATNTTATFAHPDEGSFITGALDGVPGAVVEASGRGVVTMRVPAVSMEAYVARARAGGADLVVGVNFITIWEHRVVSMTVKQFNLRLDDASSSIAVTPQNGVSSTHLPVATTHLSIEQTKYVENVVDLGNNTAYPQSAVLKIALGGGSSPADSTHWSLPLDSIRWSIRKSATPPASDAVWARSCSRALYDTAQETLYSQVISQKCANHDALTVGMCGTFIPGELMAGIPDQMTGLQGSIHVPLGIATVSEDMIAGGAYSLFAQYDVWTDEGGVGETTVSTVYSQLRLTNTSVSLLCANISIEDKLDEITDMDMSVGVATTSDDFTRKVLVRGNMISRASEGETATAIFKNEHTKVVHNASSYADGLISIILTGTDSFFGSTSCRLFIEDLWTVHTQNTAHTAQVLRAFRSGHAFVAAHSYNHVDVTPHETLVDICNGLLCAYRHDIQNHTVLNEYAVHEHGGSSGVFDEEDTRAWLQDHIFGPTYADRLLADSFTALFRVGGDVTGFTEIDDRYNKLYHLNPTHRWRDDTRAPMDPYNPLLLSDAVFVYAVIAFEDGSNVTQHRTVSTGTAYEINSGAPTRRPQLPVSIIKNASNSPLQTQVNAMMAMAHETPHAPETTAPAA